MRKEAKDSDDMPKALQALEALVGVWNTTGEIHPVGASPAGRLEATDSYEWMPGKRFLVHRVDARMNGQPARSMEIYGWDGKARKCVSRSYDDQGQMSDYTASLVDGRWRIQGETVRFDGHISDDGDTLTGVWELKGEDGWSKWMTIRLERAL